MLLQKKATWRVFSAELERITFVAHAGLGLIPVFNVVEDVDVIWLFTLKKKDIIKNDYYVYRLLHDEMTVTDADEYVGP